MKQHRRVFAPANLLLVHGTHRHWTPIWTPLFDCWPTSVAGVLLLGRLGVGCLEPLGAVHENDGHGYGWWKMCCRATDEGRVVGTIELQ